MTLSNKRQVFVDEYLKDLNATQAAIRAGYSPVSAKVTGSRLLTDANISGAIKERLATRIMPAEEVLTRLTDIARGDIAELMEITTSGFTLQLMIEKDGEFIINPKTKLIKKIKQKVTTFLAKKESDEDREIIETEIELYSAHEALRDLGKYHGLFVDRTDLTSNGQPLKFVEVIRTVDEQPNAEE